MTGTELAVAGIAVALGALVQGSVGFGLNLVAAPVLALIDPALVPGPALVMALALTIVMALRERRHIELRGVGWALTGRVPGTVVGAGAVALLPPRPLGLAFAGIVLAAVALTAFTPHLPRTPARLLGAGALSGFMGTASSIGGPPMAMVYAGAPGATLRATLAAFFVVGALLSLATLAAVGEFGSTEVVASLVLLPPLLVGFAASRAVAPHIDAGRTRAAVLVVSATAAVALAVTSLV